MMQYFKKTVDGSVWAFSDDQLGLIDDTLIAMTDEEIDRHLNPDQYLTDAEKREAYLITLKPLTRRQFKLVLLEKNLLNQIEDAISAIADDQIRTKIQIEYTESTEFVRSSDSVKYMCQLLDLSDEQVDAMWEEAMAL